MTSYFDGGVRQSAADRARQALTAAQEADVAVSIYSGAVNHADVVRVIRDAQVASGQAVLAVAEELAATRGEIRQVAEAVRELTATVSSVFGEVGERISDAERIVGEDITDLCNEVSLGLGELRSEVAEARVSAVAELSDIASALIVLVDRPRWWQWRRRLAHARAARQAPAAQTGETGEEVPR